MGDPRLVSTEFYFDRAARVRVGETDLLLALRVGSPRLVIADRAQNVSTYELPGPPTGLVVGDLDGDGLREEFAIACEDPPQVDLYRAAPDRTIRHLDTIGLGDGPRDLALADLDGDGIDDLVSADAIDGSISVILGDRARTRIAAGEIPFVVEIGDLNGDGALDLATLDFYSGDLTLLYGDGAGGFADTQTIGLAPGTSDLAIGDIDGDGDLDLAILGLSTDRWLALGDGAAGLGPLIELPLEEEPLREAKLPMITSPGADGLGGIGHLDRNVLSLSLVDTDTLEGAKVRLGISLFGSLAPAPPFLLVHNALDGVEFYAAREGPVPTERWRHTFEIAADTDPPSDTPAPPLRVGPLLAADLNDDGDVDLVAARDALVIFLGDGSGAFAEASRVEFLSVELSYVDQLHAGDFDGDGHIDLALQIDDALLLALGDGSGEFELSPTPASLASRSARTLVLRGPGPARILAYGSPTDIARGIEVYGAQPEGALVIENVLLPLRNQELVGVGDVDLDGDDDLIVVGPDSLFNPVTDPQLDPPPSVISIVLRDGENYSEGPRHDLQAVIEGIGPPRGLTVGDSNLDGAPEVITIGPQGVATFTGVAELDPSIILHPTEDTDFNDSLTLTEVDGDGLPDLAYVGPRDVLSTLSGASGFEGEIDRFGIASSTYTLMDVDDDGQVDLLGHTRTSLSASHFELHRAPRVVERWESAYSHVWGGAELDGDDRAEIVFFSSAAIKVMTDPGSTTPQIRALSVTDDEPGAWYPTVALDLDGDGREELLFRDFLATISAYRLLREDGGELRATPLHLPAELTEPRADVIGSADFDGDGRRDLALIRDSSIIVAYDIALGGDAADTLTAASVVTVLENAALPVDLLDLDHDGRTDIVARERVDGATVAALVAFSDHEGRWSFRRLATEAIFVRPAEGELLLRTGSTLVRRPFYRGQPLAPVRVIDDPRLSGAGQLGFGDFNGDGETDLLSGRDIESTIWLGRSESLLFGGSYPATERAVVDDFDGDGRSDLLFPGGALLPQLFLSETRR